MTRDKVGVFVSLVSTRIPFKGTGKEYIGERRCQFCHQTTRRQRQQRPSAPSLLLPGDDIPEIRDAVKAALQACCAQLRVKLLLAAARRQRAGRKKLLLRYVPDVCRAAIGVLRLMSVRYGVELAPAVAAGGAAAAGTKRRREAAPEEAAGAGAADASLEGIDPARRLLLSRFASGDVTEAVLAARLGEAVDRADLDAALDEHAGAVGGSIAGALKGGGQRGEDGEGAQDGGGGGGGGAAVFIAPLRRATLLQPDAGFVVHPHCLLQFLPAAVVAPASASSRR